MVMVTHDRYFLDSVTNRIVEIDKGNVYSYQSGYSGYLAEKEERERVTDATFQKQQNLLRIERAWMERGARARSTKQKAHIKRYEELAGISGPQHEKDLEMTSASTRLGRTIIELEDVCKSYGDKVILKDYTYFYKRGERVGYIGPNGCGKSTLMKMIDGLTGPDSGRITIGQTVKIGYYGQEIEAVDNGSLAFMNPEKRVIDYIRDTAEFVRTEEGPVSASVMLDRFLFPPEKQYAKLGKLSGGEKRRLNLLRVLMEAPNVLILDEPTNDLDIKTLQVLEDYVDHFDGLVLMVSHDRYLLDRLATSIAAFTGNGQITKYEGNYTDYYWKTHENANEVPAVNASGPSEPKEKEKNGKDTSRIEKRPRFSYSEAREYETIDEELETIEQRISEMDDEIMKSATDYGKLQELTKKKEELLELQEQKTERWMYLSELAEQIEAWEKDNRR